jgi:hypothetical protein
MDQVNIEDAINEYYKLKNKYEEENNKHKKRIINDPSLSWREKRSEYQKIIPKCINCKRPGGTIFSSKFYNKYKKEFNEFRQLKAICGVILDPCELNITINVGNYKLLSNIVTECENEMTEIKNQIINYKNKLLFGFMDTEQALDNFNKLREHLSEYTSIYQTFLENYLDIVDNSEEKRTLKENIEKSFVFIESIKQNIVDFNKTNNVQLVRDVVTIYDHSLKPLLIQITNLKYRENFVWQNEDMYHLIQRPHSIKDLEFNQGIQNVAHYNFGLGKRITRDTESDHQFEEEFEETSKEPMNINKPAISPTISEPISVPLDTPFYNKEKDKVSWNLSRYNNLWDTLPVKLKDVLKTDPEWMKSFMFNCVNAKANGKPCKMVAPPNLKVPPNQIKLPDGSYDFGVPIYNEVYNNLSEADKRNFLLLSTTKDGETTYNDYMFKLMMNRALLQYLGLNENNL